MSSTSGEDVSCPCASGQQIVLVDAAGGRSGQFTTVIGAPPSATLTYTATQVILTF